MNRLTPPFDPAPVQERATAASYAADSPVGANIRAVLNALRRHRWLALAIVAGVLVLALIATMLDTPRYTAASSVQINDQSDEVLGSEFEGNVAPPSDWDTDRFLNTQLDVLRSRALAERVVDAMDLANDQRFFAAMEADPQIANESEGTRRSLAVALLRSGAEIELKRATRIASIGFTSADADMAARVANSFAEQFIQQNLQRRFDSSQYARTFVSEQLDEARVDLEESEAALNDYARSAGLIRTRDAFAPTARDAEAGTMTSSSLLQYNEAAIRAREARIAAQSRWDAVRGTPALASQPVLANPTVQSLMTRRAELESELQAARARYLSGHPAIARLEADLAGVSSQLQRSAQEVRQSIEAEYRAAAAAEERLQGQVDEARGATLQEQQRSVRYNVLARQADTARTLYEGLLQRYRELNASAGIASSNIAIIDKAAVPERPSSPNLLRNLALALVAGMGLAGIAVFLRDQLDDIIHTPEDVERELDLPLLGVIPRAENGPALQALALPNSPIAEAYNSLRGSLLYATPTGLPRIIVVTSAQAGEGKSTTSFAIAQGLARIGRKALLIDADMRRPALHQLTSIDNTRGLTDLLVSTDSLPSAIHHLEAGSTAFDVLPAGPTPPSPSELLSTARMPQLLEEAAGLYDVVVIDSPPVLGLADAPTIAKFADGTVFVVEAERGRGGALRSALKRLRAPGPAILGAVLAKFDPSKLGNRYSAYYGYDYYAYTREADLTSP